MAHFLYYYVINLKNTMRTKIKIFALAILILGFASTSFAQNYATASTTATLVAPLSISKTADMNFGTVTATAGTVVLDYNNATTASIGITKLTGTAPSTASFIVTGEGNRAFSITYPIKVTIAGAGSASGKSLEVTGIVCDKGTTGSSITLESGTLVLKVKGTLNVLANSVAGIYTNADDLKVTVNYN